MSDAARDEAARLRAAWQARGRSAERDFYVASHPGWDDPAGRAAQARLDAALVLHGLLPDLAARDVLEIGCGTGRLAAEVAPRARSYTGLDIAPSMVAEARERCAGLANARFLECDGLRLPEAARDRDYGLVFAHAVLIHCPRDVVAAWIAAGQAALAPGGELRCQLRADPQDQAVLAALAPATSAGDAAALEEARRQLGEQQRLATSRPAALSLALPDDYMGHAFRGDEAQALLRQAAGWPFDLVRMGPAHWYARMTRPR
jgi:SAM-dependent methyltransferase